MKLIPTQDRVVVKVTPQDEKSKGGIFIPSTAEDRSKTVATGVVVAIGPGRLNEEVAIQSLRRVPMTAEVGMAVVFGKYSGSPVAVDEDGNFVIIRDGDIMAVVGSDE